MPDRPLSRPLRPDSIRTANWIKRDGARLLCVRTRNRERFYLPGGKIDPGETPRTAVMREVAEELGVQLDEPSLRQIGRFVGQGHNLPAGQHVEMTCFLADHIGDFIPGREIVEYAWLSQCDRHLMAPMCQKISAALFDI